MQKILIVYS